MIREEVRSVPPATQAFLLLVIATGYEGLFRAKGAKSSGIEGEAL